MKSYVFLVRIRDKGLAEILIRYRALREFIEGRNINLEDLIREAILKDMKEYLLHEMGIVISNLPPKVYKKFLEELSKELQRREPLTYTEENIITKWIKDEGYHKRLLMLINQLNDKIIQYNKLIELARDNHIPIMMLEHIITMLRENSYIDVAKEYEDVRIKPNIGIKLPKYILIRQNRSQY